MLQQGIILHLEPHMSPGIQMKNISDGKKGKSGTDEHGRKQIDLEYESASSHMTAESNSSSNLFKIFQISVDFQDF